MNYITFYNTANIETIRQNLKDNIRPGFIPNMTNLVEQTYRIRTGLGEGFGVVESEGFFYKNLYMQMSTLSKDEMDMVQDIDHSDSFVLLQPIMKDIESVKLIREVYDQFCTNMNPIYVLMADAMDKISEFIENIDVGEIGQKLNESGIIDKISKHLNLDD